MNDGKLIYSGNGVAVYSNRLKRNIWAQRKYKLQAGVPERIETPGTWFLFSQGQAPVEVRYKHFGGHTGERLEEVLPGSSFGIEYSEMVVISEVDQDVVLGFGDTYVSVPSFDFNTGIVKIDIAGQSHQPLVIKPQDGSCFDVNIKDHNIDPSSPIPVTIPPDIELSVVVQNDETNPVITQQRGNDFVLSFPDVVLPANMTAPVVIYEGSSEFNVATVVCIVDDNAADFVRMGSSMITASSGGRYYPGASYQTIGGDDIYGLNTGDEPVRISFNGERGPTDL